MSMKIVLTAAIIASFAGLIVYWPRAIVRALRVLFPNAIWDIRTSEPVVALTFDDGPDPTFTPKVLEILDTGQC
jgi:peptidoglycan/xylan/chitin deacetylase (PgdA/CDA1 family)